MLPIRGMLGKGPLRHCAKTSRSPVDGSTVWAELGTELGTVLGTELGTEVGGPGLRHNYTGQWSPRHQW